MEAEVVRDGLVLLENACTADDLEKFQAWWLGVKHEFAPPLDKLPPRLAETLTKVETSLQVKIER